MNPALRVYTVRYHSPCASLSSTLYLPHPADRSRRCCSTGLSLHIPRTLSLRELTCLSGCRSAPKTGFLGQNLLSRCTGVPATPVSLMFRCRVPRQVPGQQVESRSKNPTAGVMCYSSLWTGELGKMRDLKQLIHHGQMTINSDRKCLGLLDGVEILVLCQVPGRPRSSRNMAQGQNLLTRD